MRKQKFIADIVFPIDQAPIRNGLVITDSVGVIEYVGPILEDIGEVQKYNGAIVPGFVNAHCHLELSHLFEKIPSGTGLIEFITKVVSLRNFDNEIIQNAILKADMNMVKEGIVAVGDISNTLDSFVRKINSPIRYYSFVEMFDLMQTEMTEVEFEKFSKVYLSFQDTSKDRRSAVPHAPYSVSKLLFSKINKLNNEGVATVSIHNQETPDENLMFKSGAGDFVQWYDNIGMPLKNWRPSGKNSIDYAMNNMDTTHRTLFVHNTTTSIEDIEKAHKWSPNKVYWASCPNANLYIENQLPNYQNFIGTSSKVCIGTDSLSSNWTLSVLEEIKTISKYNSSIDLNNLLTWATLNGAEALGFSDVLGSISIGKKPGLNLINLDDQLKLKNDSFVYKLI